MARLVLWIVPNRFQYLPVPGFEKGEVYTGSTTYNDQNRFVSNQGLRTIVDCRECRAAGGFDENSVVVCET
jgi:hypothetical protein